jgi:hypothetical protein
MSSILVYDCWLLAVSAWSESPTGHHKSGIAGRPSLAKIDGKIDQWILNRKLLRNIRLKMVRNYFFGLPCCWCSSQLDHGYCG